MAGTTVLEGDLTRITPPARWHPDHHGDRHPGPLRSNCASTPRSRRDGSVPDHQVHLQPQGPARRRTRPGPQRVDTYDVKGRGRQRRGPRQGHHPSRVQRRGDLVKTTDARGEVLVYTYDASVGATAACTTTRCRRPPSGPSGSTTGSTPGRPCAASSPRRSATSHPARQRLQVAGPRLQHPLPAERGQLRHSVGRDRPGRHLGVLVRLLGLRRDTDTMTYPDGGGLAHGDRHDRVRRHHRSAHHADHQPADRAQLRRRPAVHRIRRADHHHPQDRRRRLRRGRHLLRRASPAGSSGPPCSPKRPSGTVADRSYDYDPSATSSASRTHRRSAAATASASATTGSRRLTSAWTPATGTDCRGPTQTSPSSADRRRTGWTGRSTDRQPHRAGRRTGAGDTTTTYAIPPPGRTSPGRTRSPAHQSTGPGPVTAAFTYDDAGNTTGRPGAAGGDRH